jgi:hypothetical protein
VEKLKKGKREKPGRCKLFICCEPQSKATASVTAILLVPHRAHPPKGSRKEFGESPLEKSIPFLWKSAMRLG